MLSPSEEPEEDAWEVHWTKLINFQWKLISGKRNRLLRIALAKRDPEMNKFVMAFLKLDRSKLTPTKETYLKMESFIKTLDGFIGMDMQTHWRMLGKVAEKQMIDPEAREVVKRLHESFAVIRPDPTNYSVAKSSPPPPSDQPAAAAVTIEEDYLHKELSLLHVMYCDKFRLNVVRTPLVHVSVTIIDPKLCSFPSFEFHVPSNYPTSDAILQLDRVLWTSTPLLASIFDKFQPLLGTKHTPKTVKAQLLSFYEVIKEEVVLSELFN